MGTSCLGANSWADELPSYSNRERVAGNELSVDYLSGDDLTQCQLSSFNIWWGLIKAAKSLKAFYLKH